MPSGFKYWASEFSRMLNLTLTLFHPFEHVEKVPNGAKDPQDLPLVAPFLTTALGAARAVLEDV